MFAALLAIETCTVLHNSKAVLHNSKAVLHNSTGILHNRSDAGARWAG